LSSFFFWSAVGFVIAIIFASFFEWALHRFVMHKRVSFFSYPFEKHALVHHQIFKADETYHLIKEEDKYTIPMAWWNGPAIIAVGINPFIVAAVLLHSWGIICGSLFACCCYYGAYEYLHWCMHLPRKRSRERSGIFFRLIGHRAAARCQLAVWGKYGHSAGGIYGCLWRPFRLLRIAAFR